MSPKISLGLYYGVSLLFSTLSILAYGLRNLERDMAGMAFTELILVAVFWKTFRATKELLVHQSLARDALVLVAAVPSTIYSFLVLITCYQRLVS